MDDHSMDEWAPITDEDLFGPEPIAPVKQEPRPVAAPPLPLLPEIKTYPPRPKPLYTASDWAIFGHWVRQKGFSIDQAAACAGIRVYDALVALEARDPWLYEFLVLVSPQNTNDYRSRRRRGFHGSVGGQAKNYERTDIKYRQRTGEEKRKGDTRLTEDEARQRFLEMLGEASPNDRVSSKERVEFVQRHHHDPDRKCGFCGGNGHDRRNCKELRNQGSVSAGSNQSVRGYEGPSAEVA